MKPYDPKLKEAAKEIEAILKKYDIMASMLLASPTHVEYLFHVFSSWSTMVTGPAPDGSGRFFMRFRSKKEDFPNKEAQHYATESTVHAITSFLQFGKMTQQRMETILSHLKDYMKIGYQVWDDPAQPKGT